MRNRIRIVLAALLIATLVLTGCERVSDRTGSDAALLVTEGYGEHILSEDGLAAGRSVMDGLRATHTVETDFGGGFVSSIDGRRMETNPARDWLYFVNGIHAGRGADAYTVRSGDRIWWDYREWQGHPTAYGAVGSWPEPFVNGYPSRPEAVTADAPFDTVLRDRGVNVVTSDSPWRVRVDSDAGLADRDPVWRRVRAASDTDLLARIHRGSVEVIDAKGRWVPVSGGRAVAVVVPTGNTTEDGGALMAVVGITRDDAARAAQTIAADPGALRGRFAVAFDGTGKPTASAGWETP